MCSVFHNLNESCLSHKLDFVKDWKRIKEMFLQILFGTLWGVNYFLHTVNERVILFPSS